MSDEKKEQPQAQIRAATPAKAETTDVVSAGQLDKLKDELIKLLDGPLESLKPRVDADQTIIETTSLLKLQNTQNKGFAFKDPEGKGVLGLAGLQANTKTYFEAKLAELLKVEDVNNQQQMKEVADKKKAILDKLEELHKARLKFLQQTVQSETRESAQKSYAALKTHLRFSEDDLRKQIGAGENAEGSGPRSTLISDLRQHPQKKLQLQTDTAPKKGGEPPYVELLEEEDEEGNLSSELRGNDPVALGMAFAAAGWKAVKISSPNVEFALQTARAALAHGVERVVFSEEIEKKLLDAHNFWSQKEYDRLHGEYMAIKKQMSFKLNREADKTYNNAFSSEEVKKKGQAKDAKDAETFNVDLWKQISEHDYMAHAGFLASLNDEQKAKLAYDLAQDRNLGAYWIQEPAMFALSNKKVPVNVVDYIHHYIRGENGKKAFIRQLIDVTTKNTVENIPEAFKKDPDNVGRHFSNVIYSPVSNDHTRLSIQQGLVKKINSMTFSDDDKQNDEAKDKARARMLVDYIHDALKGKDSVAFGDKNPNNFANMAKIIVQDVVADKKAVLDYVTKKAYAEHMSKYENQPQDIQKARSAEAMKVIEPMYAQLEKAFQNSAIINSKKGQAPFKQPVQQQNEQQNEPPPNPNESIIIK